MMFLSMNQMTMAAKKVTVKRPKGLKVKDYDKNYVKLTWKKTAKATGYVVYRYSAVNRKYIKVKSTKKLYYHAYGLTSNMSYRFKIKAYRRVGKRTYYSKYSSVVRVKTKADPTRSVSTIKNFLKTAVKPIGKTVYVWGGGWSTDGLNGSVEGRSMGVAKRWANFYDQQTSSYNYLNTQYQRRDGVDCSGYVGWCIYNIMNTKSGNNGYVMYAQKMAKTYSSYGWGSFKKKTKVKSYKPGDIMSSDCSCCGHVWIVIGACEDGSVVALHSTSHGGVQLSGTVSATGKTNSQAATLAAAYMEQYFPEWCQKFTPLTKNSAYLSHYVQMSWDVSGNTIMTDPEGYQNMNAEQVLRELFGPLNNN